MDQDRLTNYLVFSIAHKKSNCIKNGKKYAIKNIFAILASSCVLCENKS